MAVAQLMLERTGGYEPDYLYFACSLSPQGAKRHKPQRRRGLHRLYSAAMECLLLRPRI